MRVIKVKYNDSDVMARIYLKESKIVVESLKEKDKKNIQGLIENWGGIYKKKDDELFKMIPDISTIYSRIFFSNIMKEEE